MWTVSEAEAGKTSSHHFSPSMCMDHALGHARKWGQSQPEVLAGRNTPHILHIFGATRYPMPFVISRLI